MLKLGTGWRQALAGGAVGWPVRVAAVLSLLIWAGAVLAGRWIAFVE
ncbi:hypothetical protein [Muricoccus roseus]|nr:hypothetical protein [Roseomonas rosea]